MPQPYRLRTVRLRLEELEVREVPSAVIADDFGTTRLGGLPDNWSGWTSDANPGFGGASLRTLSPARSLSDSGLSNHGARAWANDSVPGDSEVSASFYLDSLIPAQVFLRGSNLQSNTPRYYAASVTRGMEVRIQEVVNGNSTTLATLHSTGYLSGNWVRVTLGASGDQLQVRVQRLDTNQWLNASGGWQAAKTSALELLDGTISGAGQAGVARTASYAGPIYLDNFEVDSLAGDTQPPSVAISTPAVGAALSGTARFSATAADASGIDRVEFWVDNSLRATLRTSPYPTDIDTRTLSNGNHTLLVKAYDTAGNVGTATRSFTVTNVITGLPAIPRHYSHIRIADLAYFGNPMGAIEQQLLRDSVDLVVPNTMYLDQIAAVSPSTPQLIYTNVSNLYEGLLADWLNYADRNGLSRENAFYHVTQPTPFMGSSPSSQPVTWFWNVGRGNADTSGVTTLTYQARSSTVSDTAFGGSGQALFIGYTDRFREISMALARGAAGNWNGALEYASAVDANGKPTAWRTLSTLSNTTNGFRNSGQVLFDPPADWKAAVVPGYTARLFYVRVRTTSGTADVAPIASTILGRDYVGANGGTSGTIPAFDFTADRNGDGYLSDAEYASRATGKNARFAYESRLLYPYYGQMRLVTNPSGLGVQDWAADYHDRLLDAQPLAGGLFVDNSNGKLPINGTPVAESTATYAADYGALLGAINRAIAPHWILANTVGGGAETDQVVRQVPATIEEFALRPLAATWSSFNDVANLVARRQSAASPTPYLILDSLPTGGSPTDPRTQIATLAYYYLLGNPNTTFLMFYGGNEPASTWSRHWTPAAAFDVGQPVGTWSIFATGTDPTNAALTYKVMQRSYQNALVLYKPLSYTLGKGTGTLADATATRHTLGGNYRLLRADGTLGPIVSEVTLRNGEGAILVKA